MNRFSLVLSAAALLISCGGQAGPALDAETYVSEIMEWRAGRLERLKAPTGYLNQTGLFWLDAGSYSFGSAATNDVVFPGSGAAKIGTFDVSEAGIRMTVEPGVQVLSEDQPVESILIADDRSEQPVMITHGSLAWTVVERDGNYAVRLRDFEHPFVSTFGPLPYYDIDPAMRVEATLHRYDEPRTANVGTVIEGLGYHPQTPGVVRFNIGGQAYELEAYKSGEQLFFVFGDGTNRDDTYGAGRFLYARAPGEGGATIMDFNKAYSPPCAFNDFSTCPVASPRNRLQTRVEAGEKYDSALHYSADAGH